MRWYLCRLMQLLEHIEINVIFQQGQHPSVAESAVVGYPHDIKGEGIYAYIILKDGFGSNKEMETELRGVVRQKIAAYALPDVIQVKKRKYFTSY